MYAASAVKLHVVPSLAVVIFVVLISGVAVVVLPAQNKSHAAAVEFLTATTIARSPDLFSVTENVGVHEAVLIRFDIVVKSLLASGTA